MIFATRRTLFLLFLFGSALTACAQSTFASLAGSVRDRSGALVSSAQITATRAEDHSRRTAVTDTQGSFTLVNLPPGTYSVRATSPTFSPLEQTGIALAARQNLRLELTLNPGAANTEVTVNAEEAGTINSADSSVSAALSPEAVEDLPANYRGAGSTSPLNVIQTLPGVQPDSGTYPPQPSASPNPAIKFSIQGGLPSQSETTVDGISAQNQTTNNILGDAFPSAEAISEIRVDGVGNNAEYGQPGEITTVTKAGGNKFHGSAYEFFQNSGFDAIPYGYTYASKAKKVANDFGVSLGGPLFVPHLYNGRDRTFFFADYEGLRYATARGVQYLVPTVQEKGGDFSQEEAYTGGTLRNPFMNGAAYSGNKLTPNASAAALLGLFPNPNYNVGQPVAEVLTDAIPFNYIATKNNSIDSDQFDVRIDQTLGNKGSAFARYTNKSINQVLPQDLALPNGSSFATYRIFAAAVAYSLSPHLAEEARFGFTLESDGQNNGFNGAAFTAGAMFNGLPSAPFNDVPHLQFQNLTSGGERLNQSEQSRLFQYVDNLTYTRGAHTLRFGGDIRQLRAITPLSFTPSDNDGFFQFNQTGSYTGNEFGDFLAGVPYLSEVDNVQTDNNGSAVAYAVYAQDAWKATPNLTLNFGARYELHPAFHANNGEIGNFDPSVAGTGRLIYPDGYANLLSVPELQGFNACMTAGIPGLMGTPQGGCTPVVSNSQAGLPSGLRTTPRLRLEPRVGFAYRPFGNDKTAIRGGAGYFNITTSGALFYALTGTLQSNLNTYYNSVPASGPLYSFPNVSNAAALAAPTVGTGVFYSAVDTNWHDPYSLQTSLSIDQDLGHNFGLRVSYIGLQTWHLVWQPELNQLNPSTTTIAAAQPRSAFPFPNFQAIYNRATSATANYNSGQVELNRRFAHGFSLDSSYTLAKNLADNQGTYGAAGTAQSFVDEQGGYDATDKNNRHLDYGNVIGTRRHRWITNSVYQLPVGRGKTFGSTMPRAADLLIGGWQVSGIFALQSGPALTAFIPSGTADPSGTGSGSLYYRQQRPDRIASGNYAGHTRNQWFNKNAFVCPGGSGIDQTTGAAITGPASLQNGACVVGSLDSINGATAVPIAPIGRYGTESIGDLRGPGLISLSTGLSKAFNLTEGLRLRAEGTFTNVLNHTNLADPTLDVTNPSFGVITQARGSDFGGNRTGQVALRLEF